jgi:single-stranded DNA-binding protein
MLDALASGKLYGKPQERASRDGAHRFVTAKLRCAGEDGDSFFVNVIVFSDLAKAALLTLDDGDSVSLSGTLTPKVWTDKNGEAKPALDMTAHAVLTAYHAKRKRAAVAQASAVKAQTYRAHRLREKAMDRRWRAHSATTRSETTMSISERDNVASDSAASAAKSRFSIGPIENTLFPRS